MARLLDTIFESLSTNTLVFSSQIVADSYTYSYARKFGSAFKDRAISWDKFRDSCTDYPKDFKKADSIDRRLFVEFFRDFDKLRYYSDYYYKEALPAFKRSVANSLPQLCRTCKEDSTIRQEFLDRNPNRDLINDIKLIIPAYRTYLQEHKLYEPSLLEPDFSKAENYVIVFPQTFRDSDVLKAIKYCKTIDVPTEDLFKGFEVHNNSVSEIRTVIRKIDGLLKEGVKPYDIAITCADLQKYRPNLLLESKLRDIELDFMDSSSLSVLPPGRFFKAFLNLRKNNWNFDSLKPFILDPMIPFKDMNTYPWIVQCGYKLKSKNANLQKCQERLKLNVEKPDFFDTQEDRDNNQKAYDSFVRLSESLDNFETQRKTNCLSEAFMTFSKAVLDDGQWTSIDDSQSPQGKFSKVFGSCMDQLKKLEDKASKVGITNQEIILEMFSDVLDSENYLENLPRMGIKVYSYPLSSGLCIKYHYVLNLSEKGTKKYRDQFTILDDSKEDIGHFILACYLSSNSILSGSIDSFSGPAVIPTDFLEKGRTYKAIKEEDSFDRETEVWDGKQKAIEMSASQKQGFEKTLNKIERNNYGLNNKQTLEKPFKLNISAIKDFESCPYKIFANNVLKIKESLYEMDMEDAANVGNVLHKTVQKALKEAKSISKIDKKRLREIFAYYVYQVYQNQKDAPPKEYLDHIYKSFEEKLNDFVTNANELCDYEFDSMEDETKGTVVVDDVAYSGRADLVLKDKDGNYAVIDMKKDASSYVKTTDLSKTSLQVALYSKLLEENPKYKRTPVAGYYYSFKEGRYYRIWPEGGHDKDWSMDIVKANMNARLGIINFVVQKKDFDPRPNKETCSFCPYKNLCRGGFQIQ